VEKRSRYLASEAGVDRHRLPYSVGSGAGRAMLVNRCPSLRSDLLSWTRRSREDEIEWKDDPGKGGESPPVGKEKELSLA